MKSSPSLSPTTKECLDRLEALYTRHKIDRLLGASDEAVETVLKMGFPSSTSVRAIAAYQFRFLAKLAISDPMDALEAIEGFEAVGDDYFDATPAPHA